MKRTLWIGTSVVLGLHLCGGGRQSRAQVVVAATVACATSVDGSVVGILNPLNPPVVAAVYTGTLPAGNYYTQIGWYDAALHGTLVSPEVQTQLTATGELQVNLPTSGAPSTAVGMRVYIGSASGTETLQGSTTGAATFTQSTPLAAGTALPAINTTVCSIVANDAGWPSGTGYRVSLQTPAGDTLPGYPMQWQLLGPGTIVNLANGLPLYNGTVTYPIPVLARPYNHAPQSISGSLSLTNYSLTQVGKLGVGTNVPGWPIDVENGPINTNAGYIYNGGIGVTSGQCLVAGSSAYHTFTPQTCYTPPTPATIYYQTLKFNNTAATQALAENYSTRFTFANASGQTNVDVNAPGSGNILATETANPGASVNCATYDGAGNLVPTGQPCFNPSATLVNLYWTFTTCANAVGQPQRCLGTTTLPGNMPDANYQMFCQVNTGNEPSDQFIVLKQAVMPTTAGGTIAYSMDQPLQAGTAGGVTMTGYCYAHHS